MPIQDDDLLTPEELAGFSSHEGAVIIGVCAMFLFLADVSLFIRLGDEFRRKRKLFFDDYAAIFAALCSNAVAICYMWATHNGLGKHTSRIIHEDPHPPSHLRNLFKILYFDAVMSPFSLSGIKISLLFFYRRVFLVNQRWLHISWWINFVYVILWTIAAIIVYTLMCIPPSYYWDQVYEIVGLEPPIRGHCLSDDGTHVALPIIFSVISDIGILTLPMYTLSLLKVHWKKKVGLYIIFGCGTIACLCEVGRIVCMIKDFSTMGPAYNQTTMTFIIFTNAAPNIAIFAANMPFIGSCARDLRTKSQARRLERWEQRERDAWNNRKPSEAESSESAESPNRIDDLENGKKLLERMEKQELQGRSAVRYKAARG